LTCRKIAVREDILLVPPKPRNPDAVQATSWENASSVPGRTHTAVVASSGAANPRVPVPKLRVASLSPTFAERDFTFSFRVFGATGGEAISRRAPPICSGQHAQKARRAGFVPLCATILQLHLGKTFPVRRRKVLVGRCQGRDFLALHSAAARRPTSCGVGRRLERALAVRQSLPGYRLRRSPRSPYRLSCALRNEFTQVTTGGSEQKARDHCSSLVHWSGGSAFL
jgi:hypothetical protein